MSLDGFDKVQKSERNTGEALNISAAGQIYLKDKVLEQMGAAAGDRVEVLVNKKEKKIAIRGCGDQVDECYLIGKNRLLTIKKALKAINKPAPMRNIKYEIKEGILYLTF